MYFHGVPSSRLDCAMFANQPFLDRLGVRLIAVDRPGCGQSGYLRRRRIADWPNDISRLADHLNLDSFAVLGWSGGGPYALACALLIPQRVKKAIVVSSVAPHVLPGLTDGIQHDALKFFNMNRKYPLAGRVLDRLMAFGSRHDHERFMKSTVSSLPPIDRAAMGAPTVAEAYVAAVEEAFRQGPRGPQVDAALISGAWDLELQSIGTNVLLWHGEHDTNAPPAMGRWLTQALPNCTSRFVAGEGHISLIVNWAEAIFREAGT